MNLTPTLQLLNGDCLAVMRDMPDASVDAVVCDPPYGLSAEPDMAEVMRHWMVGDDYTHTGKNGFMGKSWDSFVPGPSVWREALRVLKPGGHLAAFFGARTYDIGTLAIRLAGFEIRDQLAWVYGSGFPKSLNVSKAIDATMLTGGSRTEDMRRVAMGDKYEPSGRGRVNYDNGSGSQMNGTADPSSPATPEAARWAGWGTSLKPAFEPVVLARRPLPEDTGRVITVANLHKLRAQLWLMWCANSAERPFPSIQNGCGEAFAIAQWTADDLTNTLADLYGRMDMSRCELALGTSLNTVSSWLDTLAEFSKLGNTSTTETTSSTTTDWKTLNFCTSETTPVCTILGLMEAGGITQRANNAVRYLSVELARLKCTLELSALARAIGSDRIHSLDADAKVLVEPICLARKPLIGTVAANVLQHGTGGINVDGCRVGTEERTYSPKGTSTNAAMIRVPEHRAGFAGGEVTVQGRFPANLIHDGSDEVLARFPVTGPSRPNTKPAESYVPNGQNDVYGAGMGGGYHPGFADVSGSAARFFYCAKASRSDRQEGNDHPTVKPTALMQWLCRLVTPPGGLVLDPFMGSGSTGKAAHNEGFRFVGIERDPDYYAMAMARVWDHVST